MFLFLPKWVSLEYKTVVVFQDSKKNLHHVAVAAKNHYDSVSFTYANQAGCSTIMGSIFKRTLTVRSLSWCYIFLLVSSSGTTHHNLHGLHIKVVITRNATYSTASRDSGTELQWQTETPFHTGSGAVPTSSTETAAPPEIWGGWQQSASGPRPKEMLLLASKEILSAQHLVVGSILLSLRVPTGRVRVWTRRHLHRAACEGSTSRKPGSQPGCNQTGITAPTSG